MPPSEQRPDGGPAAFTCPHYDPVPGSKRCRQYVEGGACARPEEFMCLEWLKANGHFVPPPPSPQEAATSPPAPGASPETPPVRVLNDEQIASFKALGAEACIGLAGGGSLWLVPEYTEADREELSIKHAATLAALCAVFPGAGVLALLRTGAGARQSDPGWRTR